MVKKYGKVLVLMGGWSNEREISLISGKSVLDSLISSGVDAHELILDKKNIELIKKISPDRVFIVLHGEGGEDGEIQSYLDKLSIPYTGSGSSSSEICMNKRKTKLKLLKNRFQTPKYVKIENNLEIKFIEKNFSYPLVVKPASEGSSIGVFIVDNKHELYNAVEENRKISEDFIVEQYIDGEEYTVGIINDLALPSIKLKPPGKFYDYDAKYLSDETKYICPCGLDAEIEMAINEECERAFNLFNIKGWGRLDFFLDQHNAPVILEINTVPGMTTHSLVPMSAKEAGINFESLCFEILKSSG